MHAADGLAYRAEQHARTGVEQKRLVIANQVLVEGEAAGTTLGGTGVLIRKMPSAISSTRVAEA